MNNPPPILDDDDAPILTAELRARARPAAEVLPAEVLSTFRSRGRPKSASAKKAVNVRLSPRVIEHFKAAGRGWQTRLSEVLEAHVNKAGGE